MNYFIDFDHTLYNTSELKKDMLTHLAQFISKGNNVAYNDVYNSLIAKFQRGANNIYDIYDLIDYFSTIYNFDINEANFIIDKLLSQGKKYLFEDTIPFLEYLKKQGSNVYILSYNENEVYFQAIKIAGSGISKLVNAIIPTITNKGEMPLDYKKSIFIDDKPKDLISIYEKKPLQIYRIRRKNETYSNIETGLPIPEFKSLSDLQNFLQKSKKMDEYTK